MSAARSRDPVGRRRALAAAAVEVIAEVGVGRATHRAVAARAGVPLGATTYYFPTLADLVAAGLEEIAARVRAEVESWAAEIGDGRDLPAVLTRLVGQNLADRSRALLEYELYLAAARNPQLRDGARAWLDGTRDLLAPITGVAAAHAIAALIDGVILQAVVTGEDFDAVTLELALTALS